MNLCFRAMKTYLIIFFVPGIFSLDVNFTFFPLLPKLHQDVQLICDYSSDYSLFTVKYFKDGAEFFRYIPSMVPPFSVFQTPGITVSLNESNGTIIKLKDVSYDSSGEYKCQVTEEAPLFITVIKEKALQVYSPELRLPSLSLEKTSYHIGDTLNATCAHGPSYPAAKLTFNVNSVSIHTPNYVSDSDDHLKTVTTSLQLQLESSHFIDNTMTLNCGAVFGEYSVSVIQIIAVDRK